LGSLRLDAAVSESGGRGLLSLGLSLYFCPEAPGLAKPVALASLALTTVHVRGLSRCRLPEGREEDPETRSCSASCKPTKKTGSAPSATCNPGGKRRSGDSSRRCGSSTIWSAAAPPAPGTPVTPAIPATPATPATPVCSRPSARMGRLFRDGLVPLLSPRFAPPLASCRGDPLLHNTIQNFASLT